MSESWVWVYGTVMFSQKLCKARIRSYLRTGMTLAISLPIKSHTCSIISRSVVWEGHWLVDISCCSNHVTVRRATGAGSLSCLNTNGWFLSPTMFPQIQEGFLTMFWHNCPHSRFHRELPVCQHRDSQWHPTPLQKRFDFYLPCVDIQVFISPQLLSIPRPLPSQYARLNLDSLEKSRYCPVKGSDTPCSSSEPVIETNVGFCTATRL